MSRYSFQTSKTVSPSMAVEESKKKTSLLSDNSWIKRDEEEDEDIDRDPNFGRSVLSRYRTSETGTSSGGDQVKTTKTTSTSSSSVQALSKRFSGSNYDTSSTLPSSQTSSTYTRSTRTSMTEEPKTSTTTTTITKDGGKITETTITSTQSVRSPVIKSPTKTETFTERVMSSSKGSTYSSYSPTRTTKVTETVTTSKGAEDKLYDTLIPSGIKDGPLDSKKTITTTETVLVRSPDSMAEDKLYDTLIPTSIKDEVSDSKTTVYSTERVTVKSSTNGDGTRTTTTRTSSSAEDDLYDTLLPRAITSNLSSPARTSSITKSEVYTVESSRGGDSPTWTSSIDRYSSDDYSSSRKSSTYSKPDSYEYTSITSPTSYTSTSYRSSRSDEPDSVYTKTSTKSVYGSLDRPVLEKDLCSYCRKPFIGDAKMVLDDMKINCHANCFKCEVCNCSLGHLKAGDSMWIYKRMVHCENCFEVTREKWRR